MVEDFTISEIRDILLGVNCLEEVAGGNIFSVIGTHGRYKIILESSPMFFIYGSDSDCSQALPSKIAFIKNIGTWDGSWDYYRISPLRFFEEIPDEARLDLAFHLELFS